MKNKLTKKQEKRFDKKFVKSEQIEDLPISISFKENISPNDVKQHLANEIARERKRIIEIVMSVLILLK